MADTTIDVLMRLIDEVSPGVDKVTSKVDSISNSATKASQAFAPASAAAAATGAAVLKMATDFDSASNGIKRTADLSTGELSKIKQEALTVAPALGVLPEKYLEIASSMAQLGTSKADLSEMTKQVIELGQATDQPVQKWEEMGKQLAATQAIFKMTTSETKAFVASVNYVDDKIGSTASQILDFTNRVGSMASTVKMSANDVAVFAGTFGKLGLPAERAATAFNSMLGTLANVNGASKNAKAAFEALGISGDDMARRINENPTKAVQYFLEKVNSSKLPLNELVANMQAAFGKEAADEILTLAKGAGTLNEGLTAVGNTTQRITELQQANAAALATTEGQMKLFSANVQAIAVQIGSAMLPALNSLLGGLVPLATAFNNLMTANPILAQIVAGFIAIVAAIAPLLAILGAVASGVGAIGTAVTALGPIITGVVGITTAAIAAIAASPALLVAAITAAVVGIVALIALNWDKVKELFNTGMEAIKTVINTGVEVINKAFGTAFDGVKTAGEVLMKTLETIFSGGMNIVSELVRKGVELIIQLIVKLVEETVKLLLKLVQEAGKAGGDMMREMANGITSNAHLVQSAMASVTNGANQYLPHSPAKKGALKDLDHVGYAFMDTIAKGIQGYRIAPTMQAATNQMSLGSDSGLGADGNSGVTVYYQPVLQVRDDKDLLQQLKDNQRELVRIIGTATQKVTRSTY